MSWAPKSATPPPGYAYGPRYRPSWLNIARGIYYIARGEPRSLARDAAYVLPDTPIPPLVRGGDNVPETGPLVLACNHYERPGLWMAWPALIAASLTLHRTGRDTHWVAIEEWESFSFHGIPIPPPVIRAAFARAFATYGILAMPAPNAPAAERAAAIRAATRLVRDDGIIGLMPEGTIGSTPELLPTPEGVGTFLLLLAAAGARILPTGLFEEDGRLVVRYGAILPLDVRDVPKGERDAWVRRRVMLAIRDL
ncbi:MAG TPA: 1-acyl-sn-glycerol-3-phosphate acyltransferase, partial [Chloroflexota bacterium]|nr:1-acyl-sn-glycerol-3-phosphate acyltransferase [Chloroflexota bacterium]